MSLSTSACSSALRSSGLKIAASAARLTVPSAFIASLPTLRVSGTCLASTTIFNVFFIMEFIWYFSFFPSPEKYSRNCTKLSFFPENQTSASRKKPPGNSLRTLRPEACDLKTFPAGSPVPFGPNGTGTKKGGHSASARPAYVRTVVICWQPSYRNVFDSGS